MPGLKRQSYRHIYFSPHLDDAVLACGGRIAEQVGDGDAVLVVTAFSGSDQEKPVAMAKSLASFVDMVARRGEDEMALARLGADPLWLGYQEAIHRSERYRGLVGMTSRIVESDAPLCQKLLADIIEVCRRAQGTHLYFPLGVGNHVDHQILFAMGTKVQERTDLNCAVTYYEDVPYVFVPYLLKRRLVAIGAEVEAGDCSRDLHWGGCAAAEILPLFQGILGVKIVKDHITRLQKLLLFLYILQIILGEILARNRGKRQRLRLIPRVSDISAYMGAKLAAAGEYRSQIDALFGELQTFQRELARYAMRCRGRPGAYLERYWRAQERRRR